LPREGDGRGCRFRVGMQGLVEPGGPTTITFLFLVVGLTVRPF
jgi:hypothetical protein